MPANGTIGDAVSVNQSTVTESLRKLIATKRIKIDFRNVENRKCRRVTFPDGRTTPWEMSRGPDRRNRPDIGHEDGRTGPRVSQAEMQAIERAVAAGKVRVLPPVYERHEDQFYRRIGR